MSEVIVKCDYCGQNAKLVTGLDVYPHRRDLRKKVFWMCDRCDAYVGVHKNSPTYKPMGRLANAELRAAKVRAHEAFDPMWTEGYRTRSQAYSRLAFLLKINKVDCHIGRFDLDMCKKVVEVCKG